METKSLREILDGLVSSADETSAILESINKPQPKTPSLEVLRGAIAENESEYQQKMRLERDRVQLGKKSVEASTLTRDGLYAQYGGRDKSLKALAAEAYQTQSASLKESALSRPSGVSDVSFRDAHDRVGKSDLGGLQKIIDQGIKTKDFALLRAAASRILTEGGLDIASRKINAIAAADPEGVGKWLAWQEKNSPKTKNPFGW